MKRRASRRTVAVLATIITLGVIGSVAVIARWQMSRDCIRWATPPAGVAPGMRLCVERLVFCVETPYYEHG